VIDPVAFLAAKAEELRDLASQLPEIAKELRHMAEDCEAWAEELKQDRPRGARA
jgi:FtsZ-binding cell division protein ZapB